VSAVRPVGALPRTASPRPDVEGLLPTVSGLVLRAVVGALGLVAVLGVVLAAGGGGLRVLAVVLLLVLVVGMLALPVSPLPTVFVVVAALVVLDAQVPLWLVVPVGGLLHAVHVGVAWCAVVPPGGRVERAALVPSVRRWALAQVLCLPVALGSALVAPGGLDGAWAQAGTAVAALVVVAAGVVLVRLASAALRRSS
jgi:hypothetical protein